MKIYQKKAKSCLSNFLYKPRFFLSAIPNKNLKNGPSNQLQNDIEFQFDFFFKNRSNLISSKAKLSFLQKNKDRFNKIENKISADIERKADINDFIYISKYLNILSVNHDLKQKFFNIFLENLPKLNLGPALETAWYFCLDENNENKKNMYNKLMTNYLNHKMDSNFSQNYSTSYKVMLSQLRFDALTCNLDILSQTKGTENIECVTLEEIPINLFQDIGENLKEKGISVLSINNFYEIYNLGIELENKVVLDLWRNENKELNSVFKLIRMNHLIRSGYELISIKLNNLKNVDINEICKSINEFQPKAKTT